MLVVNVIGHSVPIVTDNIFYNLIRNDTDYLQSLRLSLFCLATTSSYENSRPLFSFWHFRIPSATFNDIIEHF